MINEIERWKQAELWLEECDDRLTTILEGEEDETSYYILSEAQRQVRKMGLWYSRKIKSRETLKAQLQGSLSQATDGGGE